MRIHFIAIGGAIMHSLAIELKSIGHVISGSDDIIYEPAQTNLLSHGLLPQFNGWSINNISPDLDLIIIGMHAKADNPELLKAQQLNISIVSFPEFIFNYNKSNKRIVIAGSHGKTTISTMICHVLYSQGLEFDYVLGAKIPKFNNLVKLRNNEIIVIEGDEYFSSSIDMQPKFMHYNPDILVISGVVWDHVNVFPSLKSYEDAFKKIIKKVQKSNGTIFYCTDDHFLSSYLSPNKYLHPYSLPDYLVENNIFYINYNDNYIPLTVFGRHNLYNIEAAKNVCVELGISELNFYSSIKNFNGAYNRLQILKKYKNNCCVYRDFAHSPSKVLASVSAVHELYPNRYLIACLELHTYSSVNPSFISNYLKVCDDADEVWIFINPSKKVPSKELLSDAMINSAFNHSNLTILRKVKDLVLKLNNFSVQNCNLIMMSSGNFSGINLNEALK